MDFSFPDLLARYLRGRFEQGEFAELVGVGRSKMSRIANGERAPDTEDLEKWADVLEITDTAARNEFIVAGTLALAPKPVIQLFEKTLAELKEAKQELLTLNASYSHLLAEWRRRPPAAE